MEPSFVVPLFVNHVGSTSTLNQTTSLLLREPVSSQPAKQSRGLSQSRKSTFLRLQKFECFPEYTGFHASKTLQLSGTSCNDMRLVMKQESAASGRGVFNINITGDNISLTDSIRDYALEKVGSAVSPFKNFITGVDIHLSVSKNPRVHFTQEAEVVVFASGTVIRAAERSENLYASIDAAADKVFRNLVKYKEKRQEKHPHGSLNQVAVELPDSFAEAAPVSDSNGVRSVGIVKKKKFPMPAMGVEDALDCLDFLDHDFYVFRNSETGQVNVVYERQDGGYGLIEPEL